jgi:glycine betaine catabolism B
MERMLDRFLNQFPMYRVVMYGLLILQTVSILFGFFGVLPYSGSVLLVHALVLFLTTAVVHSFSSKICRIPVNTESSTITALILFFLLWPLGEVKYVFITMAAVVLAHVSKYIFAIKKVHVFNPAAMAVFILGLLGQGVVSWWVGSTVLMPFVAVIGLFIVHKIRRKTMVVWFVFSALVTLTVSSLWNSQSPWETVRLALLSGPLLFFATVMFTEPLTTPSTRRLQMKYGLLVGILYGLQFSVGRLYSSPEFALLVGNMFSFIVSKRQRLTLTVKKVIEEAKGMRSLYFSSDIPVHYLPGQYMEWTLPHTPTDSRGNRRYFTIASSPTETDLQISVKIPYNTISSFKQTLVSLKVGDTIIANQVAGDFILPEDQSIPLVFIAGGVGITPFRSMIAFLVDQHQRRTIHLLYIASDPDEFAYQSLFQQAEKELGIHVHYMLSTKDTSSNWKGLSGRVSKTMIENIVHEPKKYQWFISGPQRLVHSTSHVLTELLIPSHQVHTDYFPGF